MRSGSLRQEICKRQCTAIDQDSMRAVLTSVSDIILRGNIQAAVSRSFWQAIVLILEAELFVLYIDPP